MTPWVGGLSKPVAELRIQIVEVPKAAGQEEVLTDIAKGPLHLALGLRPIGGADQGLIAVVIGKRDQGGIVNHRTNLVGAGDHGLHVILENLLRHATEIGKRVDMAAKSGRQLQVWTEPAPEKVALAKHHREQPDHLPATGCVGELDLEIGKIDLSPLELAGDHPGRFSLQPDKGVLGYAVRAWVSRRQAPSRGRRTAKVCPLRCTSRRY